MNCESEHDLTCRNVDHTGYPNNWDIPYPGYTPLTFGLPSLGKVHIEDDTSSSESKIVLVSSNRHTVTIGDSPIKRPRYLKGELILSVGEMEDLVLNSEGESFSEPTSSDSDSEDDYMDMLFLQPTHPSVEDRNHKI